jgi:hypothetical protein
VFIIKDLEMAVFGSVHSRGVAGAFFISVDSAGVRGCRGGRGKDPKV